MVNLTPREIEILRLIAQGYSNKNIATQLGVSNGIVGNQIYFMMLKLGANNRTHAVIIALRLGLISIVPIKDLADRINN